MSEPVKYVNDNQDVRWQPHNSRGKRLWWIVGCRVWEPDGPLRTEPVLYRSRGCAVRVGLRSDRRFAKQWWPSEDSA